LRLNGTGAQVCLADGLHRPPPRSGKSRHGYVIDEVAHGEGHFLGRTETLERMQSDFVYPEVGDRRTIDEWAADGSRHIRSVAVDRTRQILQQHYPGHLTEELDRGLREKFEIRLPKSDMQAN